MGRSTGDIAGAGPVNDDTGPRDTRASERDGICWHNHDGRHAKCFPPRPCMCHVCGWASQEMSRNKKNMARVHEMARIQGEKDRVAHLIEQNRPVPVKRIYDAAGWGIGVNALIFFAAALVGHVEAGILVLILVSPVITCHIAAMKGKR